MTSARSAGARNTASTVACVGTAPGCVGTLTIAVAASACLLSRNRSEIDAYVASNPSSAPALSNMAKQYHGMLMMLAKPTQWNEQRKMLRQLDANSAKEVLALLQKLNQEFHKTIIMVTHDPHSAAAAREKTIAVQCCAAACGVDANSQDIVRAKSESRPGTGEPQD